MSAAGSDYSQVLTEAWSAAIAAADPARSLDGNFPAAGSGRLVIVALGKAALPMARAALEHYGDLLPSISGTVVSPAPLPGSLGPLSCHRGGHPLPTAESVAAGHAVLRSVEGLTEGDQVLCLISGGASAAATVPVGLDLRELRDLNQELLTSGAGIREINTVRRKLCRLKGGGLARAAAPARVTALVVSDVVGDSLPDIASGPTSADPDGAADALQVLDDWQIRSPAARVALQGLVGRPEQVPENTHNRIVANGEASLTAAASELRAAGFAPYLLSASVEGDSTEAAASHAQVIRQARLGAQELKRPCALLSGGETTVPVASATSGTGGRNSHFALALACELWNEPGLSALCADSDGIDGASDAAGALLTPALFESATLSAAREALARFDSGGFFRQHGHEFTTGATGTNVNDLRLILLDSE